MKTSNFEFLEEEFPLLYNLAQAAEYNLYADPSTSLMKLRQFGEHMTELIFDTIGLDLPQENGFHTRIVKLYREKVLPATINDLFFVVRKKGNIASHTYVGTTDDATTVLSAAFKIGKWFYESYSVKNSDLSRYKFQVPENLDARHALHELEKQHEALRIQFEKYIAKEKQVSDASKAEYAQRSQKSASKLGMDERETRALIDAQLRQAGWEADTETLNAHKGTLPEKGRNIAIAEWPCGTGRADYALFIGKDLYGLVEAKKYNQDISTNLDQSKRYAEQIKESTIYNLLGNWDGYSVPFLFSTNGRPYLKQIATKSGIWFLDTRDQHNNSRSIKGWFKPEGLVRLYEQDINEANKKLETSPLDFLQSHSGMSLRDYQIRAIEAVEDILINHPKQRRALLAMATGTGKTRTIIGLCYHLIKNNRFNRILFLVDRTLLGGQAHDAFKDNKIVDLNTFSEIYEIKGLSSLIPDVDTRLHFATVQGMVKRLFYREDSENPITVDTYDCIVVDEAHRGYLLDREMGDEDLDFKDQSDYISKYRQVLDYFDAFAVGLTATPALQTTEIFGRPIFNYGLREAVIDGYLVDQEPPYLIKTKLSQEGIVWEKGEKPKVYDKEGNTIIELAELDDELRIEVSDFNKRVITENFNRTVIRELVKELDPDSMEKTLVFAATDEHADMVVKILKEEFKAIGVEVPDNAIVKITGKSDKPAELVKRYKNEKHPNIAVTVDLLTTGIDVPQICNLVFIRRIRSRILYDQMIGRATRLCPDIQKESFRIFDAVGIYDALKEYTEMKPVVANPKTTFSQLVEELSMIDTQERTLQQIDQLLAKLQRKKHQQVIDDEKFAVHTGVQHVDEWIMNLRNTDLSNKIQQIQKVRGLWAYLDETKPSPQHQLYSDHEDVLRNVERGYGEAQRPEDYIEGFSNFINSNINHIGALRLICTAPKELKRKDLKELLLTLDHAGYDLQTLRQAWKSAKHEDVAADIIAYIRTLTLGSTLISKEQRVKNAFEKVRAQRQWTRTQQNWLKKIEGQMLAETIVTREDFDREPFKENGGFKRLNGVFENRLEEVLDEINANLYDTQTA